MVLRSEEFETEVVVPGQLVVQVGGSLSCFNIQEYMYIYSRINFQFKVRHNYLYCNFSKGRGQK